MKNKINLRRIKKKKEVVFFLHKLKFGSSATHESILHVTEQYKNVMKDFNDVHHIFTMVIIDDDTVSFDYEIINLNKLRDLGDVIEKDLIPNIPMHIRDRITLEILTKNI